MHVCKNPTTDHILSQISPMFIIFLNIHFNIVLQWVSYGTRKQSVKTGPWPDQRGVRSGFGKGLRASRRGGACYRPLPAPDITPRWFGKDSALTDRFQYLRPFWRVWFTHRPVDGGSDGIRNIGKLLLGYVALQPRRWPSLYSSSWKP